MERCPNCGADLKPGARFCANCAFDLSQSTGQAGFAPTQVMQPNVCPNCGASVSPGARFCNSCASPVSAAAGQDYQAGYQGYGPSPGASSTNKTPIIIAAIVAVLLIGGGLTAFLLLRDGSSSTGGATGSSERPGDVVKRMIQAAVNSDRATVRSTMARSVSDKDVDELVNDAGDDIRRRGGLDSINITDEAISGDTARVRFEVKSRNGNVDRGTAEMIKEDGVWKVKSL